MDGVVTDGAWANGLRRIKLSPATTCLDLVTPDPPLALHVHHGRVHPCGTQRGAAPLPALVPQFHHASPFPLAQSRRLTRWAGWAYPRITPPTSPKPQTPCAAAVAVATRPRYCPCQHPLCAPPSVRSHNTILPATTVHLPRLPATSVLLSCSLPSTRNFAMHPTPRITVVTPSSSCQSPLPCTHYAVLCAPKATGGGAARSSPHTACRAGRPPVALSFVVP